MRSIVAPVRIGPIEYELQSLDAGVGIEGPRDYIVLRLQPRGVRLDNDGCYRHWISPNHKLWTLEHDGIGWRAQSNEVNGRRFADGHVLRLADDTAPRGAYVSSLPFASERARFVLQPGTVYQLEWAIAEDLRGMALYLSKLD